MYAVVTPMLPYFARTLPATKPELGLLAGAYAAGVIPGALIGGKLSVRWACAVPALAAMLLFALAVPAFGFVGNLMALDALRFIQGIACGCLWGGALTWIIAVAPDDRRGEMVGLAVSSAIVGTMIGPVLGVIAVEVSAQLVFSLVGVAALAGAALVARSAEPELHLEPGSASARVLLGHPRALLGVWLTMLKGIAFGGLYVLLPLRMAQLGGSSIAIGLTFLGSSVVAMFVAPRVGIICDRRGTFLPVSIALASSAALVALLSVPNSAVVLAVLSIVVMGAPLSAYLVPSVSMTSGAAEAAGVALAVSTMLINLAYALGETFGAPLSASVSHHSSDAVPFTGIAILMALTIIPVVTLRLRDGHAQVFVN